MESILREQIESIASRDGGLTNPTLHFLYRRDTDLFIFITAPVVEVSMGAIEGFVVIVLWNLLPQVSVILSLVTFALRFGSTRASSRGTTHIQSSNAAVLPLGKPPSPKTYHSYSCFLRLHTVNPSFLRGPSFDLQLIANATKSARSIFQTYPLSSLVQSISSGGEITPGLSAVPLNASDEVWQDHALSALQPTLHPIGTAAMLPKEIGGVVGCDLRVYGTRNVRVVGGQLSPMIRTLSISRADCPSVSSFE